jgi:glycosyltransferase involved in cell wall biosynthesis
MSEVRKQNVDYEHPNTEGGRGIRILMLLDRFFPPDIRVEKEARTLLKAGHDVFLLSLGRGEMLNDELVEGIRVIRKKLPQSLPRRVWNFLWFQASFVHPILGRALADTIKEYGVEAIHAHDLPMVKTAISVAKKFNIPLIADLHENYPEGVRAWSKVKMSLIRKLFNLLSPIWRWKRLERMVLQRVDRIITVVDEAKNHYVNDCGVSPEKVTVVMNAEDLEEFGNLEIDESLVTKYENDFVISYIGGFGPHRGIDTAIKSMPTVLEEIPDARLLLVGKGSGEFDKEMRELCKDLNVENNVVFTDWVDFRLVPSYIALSDVCLVPHHASGHTNTTIPHKLFQYMAMRKPVIVTDCKPLKRIVEECDCGIVVPSGDRNEMAEAVIKLYNDRELAAKLGANGRNAVEGKYNWENEAKKLCELYERLEK